jgi:predicted nucleic acid-binding protein
VRTAATQMKPVFADTSYYIALLSPTDTKHAEAVEWSESWLGHHMVTEYVLVELGGALARSPDRSFFGPFVEQVLADSGTIFVPASARLFHRGLALFAARDDKNWSFTDCISFIVMKQHRLNDALTTDRHFEQAGFKALLK